jgi:DNA-binding transcriptional LysR family regulator
MAAVARTDPNWHGVELRHLIALRAVATERSFSAAARALGYTQSAVSGQILALERLIGARLFVRVRGTRPLELTEEGRILLGHATAMLARLEAAQAEMGGAREEPLPRLRVGTFWGVGGSLAPAVCGRLRSAFTQVDVREEPSVDALLSGLERRRLEIAFTTLPLRDGPFECMPLLQDPYTVVVPRARKVALGCTITLDELAKLPLLTLDGCPAQSSFELVLQARGRPLEVRKRFDTVAAVLAFVADGFGVGLLPSLSLELPPSLAAVPLDPRVPPRVIAIAWHRDTPLEGLAQRFVEAAVDVARTFEQATPALQAAS